MIAVGFAATYGSAILELIGNVRCGNKYFIKVGYPYIMMFVIFPPVWWSLRHIRIKAGDLNVDELSAFLLDSVGFKGIKEAIPILVFGMRSFSCLQTGASSTVLCQRLILSNSKFPFYHNLTITRERTDTHQQP